MHNKPRRIQTTVLYVLDCSWNVSESNITENILFSLILRLLQNIVSYCFHNSSLIELHRCKKRDPVLSHLSGCNRQAALNSWFYFSSALFVFSENFSNCCQLQPEERTQTRDVDVYSSSHNLLCCLWRNVYVYTCLLPVHTLIYTLNNHFRIWTEFRLPIVVNCLYISSS